MGGDSEVDDALRREVFALRSQVAELQRAAARHQDTAGISLAEREELLREAERVAHLGTWTWDMESGRVSWSDELYRILGLEVGRESPSVDAFFSAVHPEDRVRAQAASEQGLKDGVLPLVDCRIVRPDGSLRRTTLSGLYLFDTEGNPRRVVGGLLDRTECLEAEAKLRRTLSLLEEAQWFARLGSWRFDPQSGEIEWSSEFRRIAGLPAEVTPSFDLFLDRVLDEDRPRFRASYEESMVSPEGFETVGRLRRPGGELRNVRVNGLLLNGADGRQEWRGTMLDITDQVRMREELAHAQKMEAVGRLAAGIAHDFNNLLTIVSGNLELLGERIGESAELNDSQGALTSAAGLTRRLLAFGRKAQLSLKSLAPNDLVRSTLELMDRLVGDEVRLVTELAPNLPQISVDALELERALVNLVANARDAMSGGGAVRIITRCAWSNGVQQVEISVADEGPGISDADRARIFEPFFTTRERTGGTGLGLATVLGTAEQHGGTVRVAARAGGGTEFTIVLPATGGVASTEESPETAVMGGELEISPLRVLVVDDEPKIGDATGRMLRARGHEARVVSEPLAALAAWAEQGHLFDLVICDVAMAQMRGPELVARLAANGVAPRVLFITGYSDEAAHSALGHPVLAKPFTVAALLESVSATVNPRSK